MFEPIRVGINGFGAMGRYLVRALHRDIKEGRLENGLIEIVAFNDVAPAKQLVHLLQHDSVYLGFDGKVSLDGSDIIVNGKKMYGSSQRKPSDINWDKYGVNIVYESSGVFVDNPDVKGHLNGLKAVIISAPSKIAEKTIIPGVNDLEYQGEELISGGSCTTNCLAPLTYVLEKELGMKSGLMSTIHAYTNDQRLVDSPHADVARSYNAALNIIPTTTGAAKAIGKVIPVLEGKMNGLSVRVPVPTVSLVDLVADFGRVVTKEEINRTLNRAAIGYLRGTLGYAEQYDEEGGPIPITSTKMISNPIPSLVDGSQTMSLENLAKVFAWYDNIAGFSHQIIKLIYLVGSEHGIVPRKELGN